MTSPIVPDIPPENGHRARVLPNGEVRGSGVSAGGGNPGEDFDDDDADMSEGVDEDIQVDPIPSDKTAPSAATSMTAPTRSAEADPSVPPSGGAATATPSGDAPTAPSASA